MLCVVINSVKTYDYSHGSNLADSDNSQKRRNEFPASFSLVASAQQHNGKGNNGRELEQRGNAH